VAFKVSSVLTGVYTRRAERDIKKLESNTKERVGKTLLRYSEEPLKFAEKLSDPILGEYRFRVGDYPGSRKPPRFKRERINAPTFGRPVPTSGGGCRATRALVRCHACVPKRTSACRHGLCLWGSTKERRNWTNMKEFGKP